MTDFSLKITDELSVLYELSLAACSSINLKENAFAFQRTLMARKNLTSAVYIKIFNQKHLSYCIPKNVYKEGFELTDEFIESFMKGEKARILNEEEIGLCKVAFNRVEEYHMCYLLGDFSLLILGRSMRPFQEIELYKLQKVAMQFGRFMNGLFFREGLKLENNKRLSTEIQLREKNGELNKYISANMQIENFAYIASHDLKAPIRHIQSFANLLADKVANKLNDNEMQFLKIIQESSGQMIFLIDDLLDYSRIESSNLNLSKVRAKDFISEVLIYLRLAIESKGAKIEVEVDDGEIVVDKQLIIKVIQGIIKNSLQYSSESIAAQIRIRSKVCTKGLLLSIVDNGPSVDPKHHLKVFEMFKKLQADNEGTGMGLAICKKIIDKHQGTIWMEKGESGGNVVSFTIPHGLDLEVQ